MVNDHTLLGVGSGHETTDTKVPRGSSCAYCACADTPIRILAWIRTSTFLAAIARIPWSASQPGYAIATLVAHVLVLGFSNYIVVFNTVEIFQYV